MMADMSTNSHTSMDIFMAIMDSGPLTLYSANNQTKIPMGTIHRHFKQLIKTGKIRVYSSSNKGRKKIEYGPTMYGIVSFYRQYREFAERVENYYLIWIENKEFQRDLEGEGFDISPDNLRKSRRVFKKYMDYFSAVEERIEKIRNGDDSISREMQVFFSSMMLSSDPRYRKLWMELYVELPGMQKSLDVYMESTIRSYKKLKRNLKK